MVKEKNGTWRLNRQIDLSVFFQLFFLASLIVGSWVNLQRQLDIVQHDVGLLLQSQKNFQMKLETLTEKSIAYQYRLSALEEVLADKKAQK